MTTPVSDKDNSEEKPFVERRSNRGGIRDGGRRQSDKNVPGGSSRVWFGLSILLTLLIMVWTFSVPFRTDKPMFSFKEAQPAKYTPPISPDIKQHPEHGMSRDQYLSYVMEIEADLKEEIAKKSWVPDNLPDRKHAKRKMQEIRDRWQDELKELEELAKDSEDGKFEEGTVTGQRAESLRKRLAETES